MASCQLIPFFITWLSGLGFNNRYIALIRFFPITRQTGSSRRSLFIPSCISNQVRPLGLCAIYCLAFLSSNLLSTWLCLSIPSGRPLITISKIFLHSIVWISQSVVNFVNSKRPFSIVSIRSSWLLRYWKRGSGSASFPVSSSSPNRPFIFILNDEGILPPCENLCF